MARHFTDKKLVIASHNPGKVGEIADLLDGFGVEVISASALGLTEPVEDGDTFMANAEIKARAATEASGLPALADDSGLCVHALGGEPGIYSARWAGPDKNFTVAMQTINDKLDAYPDRTAHFIAALALAWPDGHLEAFEGRVDGALVWPPSGNRGFGYDPMFRPVGHELTFGNFDPAEKHRVSHRADAFRQLVAACFR